MACKNTLFYGVASIPKLVRPCYTMYVKTWFTPLTEFPHTMLESFSEGSSFLLSTSRAKNMVLIERSCLQKYTCQI